MLPGLGTKGEISRGAAPKNKLQHQRNQKKTRREKKKPGMKCHKPRNPPNQHTKTTNQSETKKKTRQDKTRETKQRLKDKYREYNSRIFHLFHILEMKLLISVIKDLFNSIHHNKYSNSKINNKTID